MFPVLMTGITNAVIYFWPLVPATIGAILAITIHLAKRKTKMLQSFFDPSTPQGAFTLSTVSGYLVGLTPAL